jgi:hypothetical protein
MKLGEYPCRRFVLASQLRRELPQAEPCPRGWRTLLDRIQR